MCLIEYRCDGTIRLLFDETESLIQLLLDGDLPQKKRNVFILFNQINAFHCSLSCETINDFYIPPDIDSVSL